MCWLQALAKGRRVPAAFGSLRLAPAAGSAGSAKLSGGGGSGESGGGQAAALLDDRQVNALKGLPTLVKTTGHDSPLAVVIVYSA